MKKAKKIISELYNTPIPSIIEVIKSKIFRVDKISAPEISSGEFNFSGGELSFEEIADDKKLINKLKTNAFSLLNYFEEVLASSFEDKKIYITLDQLDENWLEGEIEEYSKILINLINVCKGINNNPKYTNKLKPIVFLRTDIYETLRFNDKNKIHQSSAVEIRWDLDSLNKMFFERIMKNKTPEIELEIDKMSNSIFEVNFVKHGATPFKHVLRNSFYRPRDVIVFFNKIRNAHTTSKRDLYTSKNLYDAERDFSISLYNELIDEWANQKPEIENYLNILQSIGVQKFNYELFEEKYTDVIGEASSVDKKNSLEFLFSNSIVGQKVNAIWEYTCTNPYLQINFSKDFHVNNGLKSRLTIVETRAKRN